MFQTKSLSKIGCTYVIMPVKNIFAPLNPTQLLEYQLVDARLLGIMLSLFLCLSLSLSLHPQIFPPPGSLTLTTPLLVVVRLFGYLFLVCQQEDD